ncbi:PREDICTED: uncharacterized protein LOC107344597 isoform X3 [Acropora digitifera]|uniref:uncharacterized protein LOC107344597 isoform X3 n=1 Tax=Acropora digitifera TaxID=70779 RepID=UPI00077AF574|nr:PREDICTED: uncharacterized protein LOC107344597 isoform X3 [Acropora digitifera]
MRALKPRCLCKCFLVLSFVSVVGILLKDVFLEKTVSRVSHFSQVSRLSRKSKGYSKAKYESKDPEITLLLRMPGKVQEQRKRFFCDFFRTTVLFWPPSYGKIVLVLDEESELDHEFGEIIPNHIRARFPDYKLEVLYEALPKDENVLEFLDAPRDAGYNRQLWSSFFFDLYTNDPIIGWMDSDAAFITPVTKSMIFSGKRLRVLGWDCTLDFVWVKQWALTTQRALGLPYVVDFMSYFPVYIYRDTFLHCREYIMKHLKVSDFEQAFRLFYFDENWLSPVSVILSYAWFFERDRYDWNMKLCTGLTEYNKRFPAAATIGPEHLEDILSQPQATFHVSYGEFLSYHILVSFCLSHKAAGNKLDICLKHKFELSHSFDLLHHDLERVRTIQPNPCSGKKAFCLGVLRHHYKEVGHEVIAKRRKLDWSSVQTTEKLARRYGITCKPLLY